MDEEQASLLPKLPYSQRLDLGARPGQVMANGHQVLGGGQQRGGEQQQPADWGARKGGADEEELQMDAGMIEREDHSPPRKETLMQHPNVPGDVGDPAQDPNNQGEDEFEEAELERPDFEEKAGQADQVRQTKGPANEPTKEKTQEDAKGPRKMADDPIDDYQEDQEQDLACLGSVQQRVMGSLLQKPPKAGSQNSQAPAGSRKITEVRWTMRMIWNWSRSFKATSKEMAERITTEGVDGLPRDRRRTSVEGQRLLRSRWSWILCLGLSKGVIPDSR
ncbi:Golgi integral membrane protein 4 [Varanus komodoensis]|nr:Golgi integral membrane protein 4 [Varanus komodoensis]